MGALVEERSMPEETKPEGTHKADCPKCGAVVYLPGTLSTYEGKVGGVVKANCAECGEVTVEGDQIRRRSE
jgi:predicted RNA-binding Zn-ribbon protein involved in translation (DUF1610 family)